MTDEAAREFWDYSLAVYRRPGVSEALIRLQDAHGADANLMLWCCWFAVSGRGTPDAAALAAAAELVAPWRRRVIEPLRAVRRDMKVGIAGAPVEEAESLRGEILRLEIEAERIEQAMLAARAPAAATPGDDPAGAARRALRAYLDGLGAGDGAEIRSALAAILAGCVGCGASG